jgi:hypothetical protein
LVLPGSANAIGHIRYENPVEHAVGLSGIAGLSANPQWRDRAYAVEAGQRFLYGIPGLASTDVRLHVMRGASGALLSSTFLSSPVGHEYRVTLEPFLGGGNTLFGVALSYESLKLRDFTAVGLGTVGFRSAVRLSKSVRLGYTVDNVRLFGVSHPGADTALYVVVQRGVSAVAQARLSRDGGVEMSFASWTRIAASLLIAAGYDDGSGLLKGGLALSIRSADVSVGASVHPLLGVSKSVFLTWRR